MKWEKFSALSAAEQKEYSYRFGQRPKCLTWHEFKRDGLRV